MFNIFEGNRWKHYLPSVFCLGLVLMVLAIPVFAVLFVVMGLSFVGGAYALVVYRMHRAQDAFESQANRQDYGQSWAQEPSVRNVTINMVNGTRWFRDLN